MTEPDVRSKYRIQQQSQAQSASQVEQQVHAENVARYDPFLAAVMGGGYFRVVSRGRGRETPVGSVSWVDNDQGRYAVLRGHGHSVFMPADQALIDRHVTQLLNSTR